MTAEGPSHRGRCKYKSGKCSNERAVKSNGKAHTLCEFHRQRQIVNQRRLLLKRRSIKDLAAASETSSDPEESPTRLNDTKLAFLNVLASSDLPSDSSFGSLEEYQQRLSIASVASDDDERELDAETYGYAFGDYRLGEPVLKKARIGGVSFLPTPGYFASHQLDLMEPVNYMKMDGRSYIPAHAVSSHEMLMSFETGNHEVTLPPQDADELYSLLADAHCHQFYDMATSRQPLTPYARVYM